MGSSTREIYCLEKSLSESNQLPVDLLLDLANGVFVHFVFYFESIKPLSLTGQCVDLLELLLEGVEVEKLLFSELS